MDPILAVPVHVLGAGEAPAPVSKEQDHEGFEMCQAERADWFLDTPRHQSKDRRERISSRLTPGPVDSVCTDMAESGIYNSHFQHCEIYAGGN
jgi:hypothetical protein